MSYWIYILQCENGHYYTGHTTDLARRYKEHQQGSAKCKYTRSFKPVAIAQSWHMQCDKSKIMKIENKIKKLTRIEKEQLILFPARLQCIIEEDEL